MTMMMTMMMMMMMMIMMIMMKKPDVLSHSDRDADAQWTGLMPRHSTTATGGLHLPMGREASLPAVTSLLFLRKIIAPFWHRTSNLRQLLQDGSDIWELRAMMLFKLLKVLKILLDLLVSNPSCEWWWILLYSLQFRLNWHHGHIVKQIRPLASSPIIHFRPWHHGVPGPEGHFLHLSWMNLWTRDRNKW